MKISKRVKISGILVLISTPMVIHSILCISENLTSMTRWLYLYFFLSGLLWSLSMLFLFIIKDKDFEKRKTTIEKLAGIE